MKIVKADIDLDLTYSNIITISILHHHENYM